MRYLQPKFSVGGASSNSYRDNFDRIFRKPETLACPEPARPVTAKTKASTCGHHAAAPMLVGKFVAKCINCSLFITTKELDRVIEFDSAAEWEAEALADEISGVGE